MNSNLPWETKTFAQRMAEALPNNLWESIGHVILAVVAIALLIVVVALILIYMERKVAAHFQCRLGPMRVGWHGTLQAFADVIKLLFKEDIVPEKADHALHLTGPFFALTATILGLMIIPYSPTFHVVDFNIGVVYLTAVSGFGVLGILLGGWSSNSKWSLLGAMRAGAQIISYEVSATLALLVVVMLSGSLQFSKIIETQASGWWIWRAHGVGLISFIIFIIASTAEVNRTPFDIAEGESELTAGFHTEFSGMRFAFYFLSEFMNMFLVCAVAATLFLGGWMPFHIGNFTAFNHLMDQIPPAVWFSAKTISLVFLMMWFRWSFPRLRVDQLMRLEWKVLLPIGFVNLLLATVIVLYDWYFFPI